MSNPLNSPHARPASEPVAGLRLNLGCGAKRFPGFINVDKFGAPDLRHDLETFPWPWPDNSVREVQMIHVLEHLGQQTSVYLRIIQELYRISQPDGLIRIIVPHPRHDYFLDDPTHVRPITPLGLQLFCQRLNQEWARLGAANSPLGLYLNVDLELIQTKYQPSTHWHRLFPDTEIDIQNLLNESAIRNNMIEQIEMILQVIKPAGSRIAAVTDESPTTPTIPVP